MTDETTGGAEIALTQEQQDQATVAAMEAQVEKDAANIAPAADAVAAAVTQLETLATTAEASTDAGAAGTGTNWTDPVNVFPAPNDKLSGVIAEGIRQYDGYPEHADKVTALREVAQYTSGMSTSTRNLLASAISIGWGGK